MADSKHPIKSDVLRLDGKQWVIVSVHADDEEVHAEPFEAPGVVLARLWT
jgi:hypothetical protein